MPLEHPQSMHDPGTELQSQELQLQQRSACGGVMHAGMTGVCSGQAAAAMIGSQGCVSSKSYPPWAISVSKNSLVGGSGCRNSGKIKK